MADETIVGNARIPVEPSFKGFQSEIKSEVEKAVGGAGSAGGRQLGRDMAEGFEAESGRLQATVARAESAVTKAADRTVAARGRAVTAAEREQDALGKLKVAQAQLSEAQEKYSEGHSRRVAAEEKAASALRDANRAARETKSAVEDLTAAERDQTDATEKLRAAQSKLDSGTGDLGRKNRDVADDLDKTTAAAERQERALDKLRDAAKLAAAAVGIAVGTLAARAVESASAAEQSSGGVEAMFGDQALAVEKQALLGIDSYGTKATDYRVLATQFGAFGKGLGKAGEELTTWVDDQIRLAADLAATYGRSPQEAAEAILSAFRGESDPIEAFGGIDTRVENVKNYGEGVGGIESAIRASEGAKAADGMAQREAGTYEGAKNRLTASVDHLLENIGGPLKDALADLFTTLNENIGPAIDRMWELWDAWEPEIKATSVALAGFVAVAASSQIVEAMATALGLLRVAVTKLLAVFAAHPALLALAAIVAALVYAWETSDEFRKTMETSFKELQVALGPALDTIKQAFGDLMEVAGPVLLAILKAFADFVAFVVSWAVPLIVDGIKALIDWCNQLAVDIIRAWLRFKPTLEALRDFFTIILPAAARALVDRVVGSVTSLRDSIADRVGSVLGKLRDLRDFVRDTLTGAFRSAVDTISGIWDGLRAKMAAPIQWVLDHLYTGGLKKLFDTIASAVGSSVRLPAAPRLDAYARGGRVRRDGLALVGEEGPELVFLNRGQYVATADQTRDIARGDTGDADRSSGGFLSGVRDTLAGLIPAGLRSALAGIASTVGEVLADPGAALRGAVKRLAGGIPFAGDFATLAVDVGQHLASTIADQVGGLFGGLLGGPGSSGALGSDWRSLWAAVGPLASSLGLRLTSAYRPGARTAGYGNVSRHAMGKAIDVAGGVQAMKTFAKVVYEKWGRDLHELLLTQVNGLYTVYRGRRYTERNPRTLDDHDDHVHLSVADTGGVLPHGQAHLNLSGRPEYTLRPADTAALFEYVRNRRARQIEAWRMPDELVVRDVDGDLIGRMRVEADHAVLEAVGASDRWG